MTTAGAEKPDVIVNDKGLEIYLLGQKKSGNEIAVHRGMRDSVTNLICEWNGAVEVKEGKISLLRADFDTVAPASDVPAEWVGGQKFSSGVAFGSEDYALRFEKAENRIVEEMRTLPNALQVTSCYRRVWDMNAGTVSVGLYEGQFVADDKGAQRYNEYMCIESEAHKIPESGKPYLQSLKESLSLG